MLAENERELPNGGIVNDRRCPETIKKTMGFVVATDSFMSGWGQALGVSYFAVPFETEEQRDIVERNLRRRSEMKRVRVVYGRHYRPKMRSGDHLSIREMKKGDTDRFFIEGGF